MKKIIILLLLSYVCINITYTNAQNHDKNPDYLKNDSLTYRGGEEPNLDDIFIIVTSTLDSTITEGVIKMVSIDSTLYDSPCVSYMFYSKSKNIDLICLHVDFNLDAIRKIRSASPDDKMKIVTMPKEFLSKITPIDLHKEGSLMTTRNDAYDFRRKMSGKKIWLIDRNDITETSVKLIQVSISSPSIFDETFRMEL